MYKITCKHVCSITCSVRRDIGNSYDVAILGEMA